MRLGGRGPKNAPASPQGTAEGEEGGVETPASQVPSRTGWHGILGGSKAGGPAKAAKAGQDTPDNDDQKIRFTIGGEGKRMNKEDFIKEVQKLDASTKKQVIEQLHAAPKQGSSSAVPQIIEPIPSPQNELDPESSPSSSNTQRQGHGQRSEPPAETRAEEKRRLAVLAGQGGDEEETPAERRRREAALGTSGDGGEDSGDEEDGAGNGGMRIRFAEPSRGRK